MKEILKPCVYKQSKHYNLRITCDGVPLASWVSELLLSGKVKSIDEAEAKASLKWAISVAGGRPEAR